VRIAGWPRILVRALAVALAIAGCGASPARAEGDDAPPGLGKEQREQLEQGLRDLTARLQALRDGQGAGPARKADHLADVAVYARGLEWALHHDTAFEPADVVVLSRALELGRTRVAALESGNAFWALASGRVTRGFVSALDGSVQPYGMVIPAGYDRNRPMRLDVVLHGSTRPLGRSELRFMSRFDAGRGQGEPAADRDYLELHPLGRVENGYRWAGEVDVFEAIAAACRNYAVDRDRIVLRGMSMGASGTWHLGLKHPDRFVALGPYCGYVETHEFSRTPLPDFAVVGPLPSHQEQTLHMLDSLDYAANAGMVPAVACMGEKDVFFQAHELMRRAMAREGLEMVNLIAPGTGHVLDPATHAEQMRRIGAIAAKGLDGFPGHVRFVTWTLKYSRCQWLQILGMEQHYARAELDAHVAADQSTVEMREPRNVTRFALLPPVTGPGALQVRVGGATVAVPAAPGTARQRGIVIARRGEHWVYQGALDDLKPDGKRPGVQGPIDDAFTTPFLCVRGTAAPWNPAVHAWADASLERFAREWHHYFRGVLPVKDDTAVTPEDVQRSSLILFGDPGSNGWIARLLPQLPVRWTRETCAIGETRAAAADHAPVLIQPSPLAPDRYVVLNSGHTFHERELSTLNYLLFPRLGDWALIRIGGQRPGAPSGPLEEQVVRSGFFDETWNVVKDEPVRGARAPDSLQTFLPRPARPEADLRSFLVRYYARSEPG
jgi:hypothetical protein